MALQRHIPYRHDELQPLDMLELRDTLRVDEWLMAQVFKIGDTEYQGTNLKKAYRR
jgi:hypothetical protein